MTSLLPWREAPYSIRVTIITSLGLEPAQPKGRLILPPQSDAEPQGTQLPATAQVLRRAEQSGGMWGLFGAIPGVFWVGRDQADMGPSF